MTTVTIDDVIAADGARVPQTEQAQTQFSAATIVLSGGRLLSPSEMAFFDLMARRAELRTATSVVSGRTRFLSIPFYLATGGRAVLTTRMW